MRRIGIALSVAGAVLLGGACTSDGGNPKAATTRTTAVSTSRSAAIPPDSVGAAPASACGSKTASTGSDGKVTITSSGQPRWYFQHVPAVSTATPLPLVIDLHGYSEGAGIHRIMSRLGEFGDKEKFVTVTPQGTGKVARWDVTLGSDDLRFIGDLLDQVEKTVCIDTNRVFATGLSNGAFMASAIACQYSDRVAAVAPVAGISDIPKCAPKRSVPVMAFHGTADGYVAYAGGYGKKVLSLPAPDGSGKTIGEETKLNGSLKGSRPPISIPDVTKLWALRNKCAAKPSQERITADVTRIHFECPTGSEVELYRVAGGGHTWPGSAFSKQIGNMVGPTTSSINANELMWAFFKAHPLQSH